MPIKIYQTGNFSGQNEPHEDIGVAHIKKNIFSYAFPNDSFVYDATSNPQAIISKVRKDRAAKQNVGLVGYCRSLDDTPGLTDVSLAYLENILLGIYQKRSIDCIPVLVFSDLEKEKLKEASKLYLGLKGVLFAPKKIITTKQLSGVIGKHFMKPENTNRFLDELS